MIIKAFITLILSLSFSTSVIATWQGEIVKITGRAYKTTPNSFIKIPLKIGSLISANEIVFTNKDSKCIILKRNDHVLVLTAHSSIKIKKASFMSRLSGKIYFFFKKFQHKSIVRNISMPTAVLGIRGTDFLINNNESTSVMLNNGKLEFTSKNDQPFSIYQEKALSEFEAYQAGLMKEFDEYKDNIEKEFIEYKKNFSITQNTTIEIDGNQVLKSALDKNAKNEIDDLKAYADEFIKDL